MKKLMILLIALLLLSACRTEEAPDTTDEAAVTSVPLTAAATEATAQDFPEEEGLPTYQELLNDPDYQLVDAEGNTEYFSGYEGRHLALYSATHYEKYTSVEIMIIVPCNYENHQEQLTDFGICGDWLVLSAGSYHGTGRYFHGYFYTVKKDGSQINRLYLTDSDEFFIIGDWIYYNGIWIEENPTFQVGGYRIRPDGSQKEYLGEEISTMLYYTGTDILYAKGTGIPLTYNNASDLKISRPEGSESAVLFSGEALTHCPGCNALQVDKVGYIIDRHEGDQITFTVYKHGYQELEDWRGSWIYVAAYTVNRDGSGLTLLEETHHHPPVG